MNLGLKRRECKFISGHKHYPAYWNKEDKEEGKTRRIVFDKMPLDEAMNGPEDGPKPLGWGNETENGL